jgi:hypothetical protein
MDLKKQKEDLLKVIQQNKMDQIQHQQHLDNLGRGSIYLQGQLDLLESMLKKEAEALKADVEKVAEEVKDALSPASNAVLDSAPEAPATAPDAAPAIVPAPPAPASS